jgi:hypothetical protein
MMIKHYGILEECLHELEKSSKDIEVKMMLETRFVRLKGLLPQNESRLYAVNSPCTINDLVQLLVMLRAWNKTTPSYVTERDIEAHALGLVRLLEKK